MRFHSSAGLSLPPRGDLNIGKVCGGADGSTLGNEHALVSSSGQCDDHRSRVSRKCRCCELAELHVGVSTL